MTEHNLILIYGDFIDFIIFTNKFINALLINLLETLEFTIIDSKYKRALIFSFIVVFVAKALYTSERWDSIAGVSIFWITYSGVHGSKVKYSGLYCTSTYFSISLFPIIGFTAVSELWIINCSIVLWGTLSCAA